MNCTEVANQAEFDAAAARGDCIHASGSAQVRAFGSTCAEPNASTCAEPDPLTAQALDLSGVNATVFTRLVQQAEHDGRGWVCSCILRQPHIGGLAAHTRLYEIRKALRGACPEFTGNPVPKQATTCPDCVSNAALAKSFGRHPSTTYAYRIAPELHGLIVVADRQGRAA